MKYRTDARHGQLRAHPETRELVWRAVGMGLGFLIAVPIFFVLFGMP